MNKKKLLEFALSHQAGKSDSTKSKILGIISLLLATVGSSATLIILLVALIILISFGAYIVLDIDEELSIPGTSFFPIAYGYDFSYSNSYGDERTYGGERKHEGIDIMCDEGTPIVAVESGKITQIGWNSLGGWRIGITTDDGRYWYYAHMRKVVPYAKDINRAVEVQAGQVIGYVGSTGYSGTILDDWMPPDNRAIDTNFEKHLHIGLYNTREVAFYEDGSSLVAVNPYETLKQLEELEQYVLVEKDGKEDGKQHYKTSGVYQVNLTGYQGRFINTIATAHEKIEDNSNVFDKYKIYHSVSIAQAILESDWGRSGLTKTANNLFGIKAGSSWTGETVSMATTEYDSSGNKSSPIETFRAYDSWQKSVIDHAELLITVETYIDNGVFSCDNYAEQAKALQEAKYATDPNYAENLISIIKQYTLYKYDEGNYFEGGF